MATLTNNVNAIGGLFKDPQPISTSGTVKKLAGAFTGDTMITSGRKLYFEGAVTHSYSTPAMSMSIGDTYIDYENVAQGKLRFYVGNGLEMYIQNSSQNGTESISVWAKGNYSGTGYITRTSIYDKSNGDALDNLKDTSEYLNPDGSINHSKFYGYVSYPVTDYSRPVNITKEREIKKYVEFNIPNGINLNEVIEVQEWGTITRFDRNENGEIVKYVILNNNGDVTSLKEIYEMEEYEEVIYPYTKQEEGVMLDKQINLQGQALAEYRSAIDVKQITGEYSSPALDTGTIMVDSILTKSKVPKVDKDYLKDLKDITKLSDKETHYAKKNVVIDGVDTSVLDLEERVVLLEGALNQMITEVCAKEGNKWSWCSS